ncbi:Negative elongation factor A [Papilio xuthus]|uniref:Negative elongation factor A n=1 Tax=Papilio xuthus TaxID=66420 RepID=A0A194QC85_PAPXU|nr:Negative elongation factor A [Papilio xuthus]
MSSPSQPAPLLVNGVPDALPAVPDALPAVLEAQPGVPDVQPDVAEALLAVPEALLAVPEAQSPAQPALAAQNDMPAQPNVPAVPEALPAGPEAPPAVPTTHARAPVPVAPVNGESVPHAEHDQPIQPAPPQPTPAPRRTLFLSQAQLLEAQEMFRTANRVTRPEKAFILGFIAGSRASPNPELGHIISIKLSDNHENVMQSDDTFITMVAEIHFQMNFSTGQWCRVKRYRPLEGAVPQKIMPGFPINQNGN